MNMLMATRRRHRGPRGACANPSSTQPSPSPRQQAVICRNRAKATASRTASSTRIRGSICWIKESRTKGWSNIRLC